jgi:Uncharacterised nucleotidyltransferase
MLISELRPEEQLLLFIARPNLDESTVQSIRGLLKRTALDWQYVGSTAASHGVSALLAHHLQSIHAEGIPSDVLLRLQAENHENTERCLWLTAELVKVAAAMQDAGIPCIPFKGPTLAVAAYEDLGLRQFTDLDLFVRKYDLARVKELLLKRGFSPARDLSGTREAALLRFDNACAFVNDRDVLLDVHWRFAPRHLSLALETDDMWRGLEKVNIGNHSLFTLSPEDLLLVLCCHGFTHQWEKLVWLSDVAGLIGRGDNLDWDYVFKKAKRLGVLRILLLGLFLASDLLGASLPCQAQDALRSETQVKRAAKEIVPHLFAPDMHPSSGWIGQQLRMRERTGDRIKSLLAILLTPRDYDWMFASIPDSVGFLYYLIRPIRMVKARGLRGLNSRSS